MSDKELPFKSIKITLSSEALARLNFIVKEASFRSYSSGIEECIRAVYDLMYEAYSVVGDPTQQAVDMNVNERAEGFRRMIMRLSRFTGRSFVVKTPKPKK